MSLPGRKSVLVNEQQPTSFSLASGHFSRAKARARHSPAYRPAHRHLPVRVDVTADTRFSQSDLTRTGVMATCRRSPGQVDLAHVSTTSRSQIRPDARSTSEQRRWPGQDVDSVRRCSEGPPDYQHDLSFSVMQEPTSIPSALDLRSWKVGSGDPVDGTGVLMIDRGDCGLGQAVQHNQIC